jgi:hypothetical protein
VSIFCTVHHHDSLEAARACREAQLRASGDLKLMLAGMPPKSVPRHHRPARADVRGKLTVYVFDEAAPRGAPLSDRDSEADTLDELLPVDPDQDGPVVSPPLPRLHEGAPSTPLKRKAGRAAQRGGQEHGRPAKPERSGRRPKKPRKS